MRYQDVNSRLTAHITSLRAVIAGLMIMIGLLGYAWHAARTAIRIHIPPDLRSGAVVKADDLAPAHVYAFAAYIFQQLNHWDSNGESDYGQQIFRMAAYLTPDFREYLSNDLALRGQRGELSGRVRSIQPVAGRGYEERRVTVIDPQTWQVWLDMSIQETVRGMDVKQVRIRYPLTVVRYDVDPELNPWGLALSGFGAEGPQRIDMNEETEISRARGGHETGP
ncbi:PFL_4703 family integrating conjugative element protein [Methylophaga sp.]|uniref:PFL_4703 family integrating conjugative element protein n=1 Tax=Methylophaga sp. TaxID=2024840 RepID=UPI00271C9168|nr:TIGR03746 family integrating conjugative element protein [Methylophaga sp.]MDO8828251.1 TIGR03746 family integrating conjugative element protein [Methylophaga sp.]